MRLSWPWRRRVSHVVGISSTTRGAGLAYLGRDGAVRAATLDGWAGVSPCLLLAADEERELRAGSSSIAAALRDELVADFGAFPPVRRFETCFQLWLDWLLRDLPVRARDIDLVVISDSHFATAPYRLRQSLGRWLPAARVIGELDQHAIHRRHAFWPGGLGEAAVVTLDCCGEPLARLGGARLTATLSRHTAADGWKVLRELREEEADAGTMVDVMSRHLGLRRTEQAAMEALASGGGDGLLAELASHLRLAADGGFRFLDGEALAAALSAYVPCRQPGEAPDPRHADVAYAARELLGRIVGNLFRAARERSGCERLAFAGELAADAGATAAACREHGSLIPYVPASPGAAGQALGCALYGAYEIAGWPPPREPLPTPGPAYTEAEIAAVVVAGGAQLRRPEQLAVELVRRLAAGEVVALFSGGAPFGEGAPGARTLLADPRRSPPAALASAAVAPLAGVAVLAEEAAHWFDPFARGGPPPHAGRARREVTGLPSPAAVWPVAPGERTLLRHVLEAFRDLSGLPLLRFAPWRGAGGATVETPEDAVGALASGAAGVLAMGPYLVTPGAAAA